MTARNPPDYVVGELEDWLALNAEVEADTDYFDRYVAGER